MGDFPSPLQDPSHPMWARVRALIARALSPTDDPPSLDDLRELEARINEMPEALRVQVLALLYAAWLRERRRYSSRAATALMRAQVDAFSRRIARGDVLLFRWFLSVVYVAFERAWQAAPELQHLVFVAQVGGTPERDAEPPVAPASMAP